MTGEAFTEVTFEVNGRVAVLTLNRPDIRNIISHEPMIADIERACARVNADMGISCLIITGAGPAGCAASATAWPPAPGTPPRARRPP